MTRLKSFLSPVFGIFLRETMGFQLWFSKKKYGLRELVEIWVLDPFPPPIKNMEPKNYGLG
jgi:hypothetical protein